MADMTGKHVLITGATNGIGEAAAYAIAKQGATVIVVSRNEAKCKRVVDDIRAETNNPNVSYIAADLSDMDAVRQVAAAYTEKFSRLDVLLNNAGTAFGERQVSADGLEMTFALNHMNYFLLTHELLPLLKQTAASEPDWGARIVNVSSEGHRTGMNWKDVQYERGYNTFAAYGQSKCMNVLFTYALASRLKDDNITVNALHPGAVNTGIWDNSFLARLIGTVMRPFFKSAENGAQTSIYLATSDEVQGVTGKYFRDCQPKKSLSLTYDKDQQERLWALSEDLAGITTSPA